MTSENTPAPNFVNNAKNVEFEQLYNLIVARNKQKDVQYKNFPEDDKGRQMFELKHIILGLTDKIGRISNVLLQTETIGTAGTTLADDMVDDAAIKLFDDVVMLCNSLGLDASSIIERTIESK